MSHLSLAVLLTSLSYLAWRTWRQWRLQQSSYEILPYPQPPLLTGRGEPDRDRARGCLLGIAVGDALGAPRESLPSWLSRLRFGRSPVLSRGVIRFMRRPGAITDDTQLTWATALAITDEARFDVHRFEAELCRWWHHRIGAGRATDRAVVGLRRGRVAADPDSQGNGAAMRIAPLAIVFADDLEGLLDAVGENARRTHPNPEAVAGAECVARLTRWCLTEGAAQADVLALEELVEAALPRRYSEDPGRWSRALEQAVSGAGLASVGTSPWVFESIVGAVALLARHGGDVDAAFVELFDCGGDVDTIAALYASWVGALVGCAPFARWAPRVQGAQLMVEQADRLYDLRVQGFGAAAEPQ